MIGQTLAHYRVLEKIGAGGMGEVYRAHDEHLDRYVALKVLPRGTLSNPSARRRFRNEALALSKLNHAHIATIHDFDTQAGVDFLVMELVTGSVLSDLLEQGPLPEERVIDIGIQIAEALEEAHERGVIHRDLKPRNIAITDKGRVKVLDFGLAKMTHPLGGSVPTAAATATLTEGRGLVGTLAYMAPEQLDGQPVDARVDIYALGLVLYEMITGERARPHSSSVELVASILQEDCKRPAKATRDVSSSLDGIVRRASARDPIDRYPTARALKNDLSLLQSGETVKVRLRRRRRRLAPVAASAVFVVATSALAWWAISDRFESALPLGAPRVTPFLVGGAAEGAMDWSPQGNLIAYESQAGGDWNIWICDVSGSNPLNLTGDDAGPDRCPAWDPDGHRLAFYSERDGPGIYTMTATGGGVRKVTSVSTFFSDMAGVRWIDDESLLFNDVDAAGSRNVHAASVRDGARRSLTEGLPGHTGDVSPNGLWLAYRDHSRGEDGEIYLRELSSGRTRRLSRQGDEPQWTPDGRQLFFISSMEGLSDLWTVRVNQGSGEFVGEPVRLTTALDISSFALGPEGRRALALRSESYSNLWVFPTDTGLITDLAQGEQMTFGDFVDTYPGWMPDGQEVLYSSDRRGNQDIWKTSLASGKSVRLTTDDGDEGYPEVSPDGFWITYYKYGLEGFGGTMVMRPDGGQLHPIDPDLKDERSFAVTGWSTDGRRVAAQILDEEGQSKLGFVRFDPESGTLADELRGTLGLAPLPSPDDRFLAYQSLLNGELDLWVVGADGSEPHRITGAPHEEWIAGWSREPSHIYFHSSSDGWRNVHRIPMDSSGHPSGPSEVWAKLPIGQMIDIRENRAVCPVQRSQSDIWLVEFVEAN